MFANQEAKKLFFELGEEIDNAPIIVPCRETDPDLWFQEYGTLSYNIPRKFCNRCPVRAKCLEFALANNEPFGMWGGKTPDERKRMKRS
jgi:hypothetical protein